MQEEEGEYKGMRGWSSGNFGGFDGTRKGAGEGATKNPASPAADWFSQSDLCLWKLILAGGRWTEETPNPKKLPAVSLLC